MEEHRNICEERLIKRAIGLAVALENDVAISAASKTYKKICSVMDLGHDEHAKYLVSHWHSECTGGSKILADAFSTRETSQGYWLLS